MARKHLDFETSCSSQIKSIQTLMAEVSICLMLLDTSDATCEFLQLATKWPDFFGGNDDGNAQALKRAMAYIRQQHSSSRSKNRRLSKRTPQVCESPCPQPQVSYCSRIAGHFPCPVGFQCARKLILFNSFRFSLTS
jgi:hypothetical protein